MCVYTQQLLIPVLRTAGEGRDWEQLPWCRGEKQHFPPDPSPASCSPAGPRPEPPRAAESPRPWQTELLVGEADTMEPRAEPLNVANSGPSPTSSSIPAQPEVSSMPAELPATAPEKCR